LGGEKKGKRHRSLKEKPYAPETFKIKGRKESRVSSDRGPNQKTTMVGGGAKEKRGVVPTMKTRYEERDGAS